MRPLKSKSKFKSPFSQERRINNKTSLGPCPATSTNQPNPQELSPLHLGRTQIVTPKTRKQILKRLVYSMNKKIVAVSPAASSPGITLLFDSQSDTKVTDTTNLNEDSETAEQHVFSEEEFDLELSPRDENKENMKETVTKTDEGIAHSREIIEVDEVNEPVTDEADEIVIQEIEKEKDNNKTKVTVCAVAESDEVPTTKLFNEENNEDSIVIGEKEKSDKEINIILQKQPDKHFVTQGMSLLKKDGEKVTHDKGPRKPNIKKKIICDDLKGQKKISKKKQNEETLRLTKRDETSSNKKKGKKNLLKCKLATVETKSGSSSTSRQKRHPATSKHKNKMKVRQDVVKMILKMHMEIENLLKHRTATVKGQVKKKSDPLRNRLRTEE